MNCIMLTTTNTYRNAKNSTMLLYIDPQTNGIMINTLDCRIGTYVGFRPDKYEMSTKNVSIQKLYMIYHVNLRHGKCLSLL